MYRWIFVSYVNISHKDLDMFDRRTLPLSALRAFESAGRHLHMGRAGDELGVTHGAISHQVRILEQYLGIKLFIRANNRLKLTSSGEHLLDAVRDGFECIIDGALRLDPDSLTGSLIIACTESTGASWAVMHIGEFQLQYPQIDVHVVEVQPQQKDIPRERLMLPSAMENRRQVVDGWSYWYHRLFFPSAAPGSFTTFLQ